MVATVMERNWTEVGAEYNSTPEQRVKLSRIFEALDWKDIPPAGMDMAMMPAMALDAAIKELNLPKVSAVATSNELAPFGLVAARAKYKNGIVEVYLLDEGSKIVVLASDFYPNDLKVS